MIKGWYTIFNNINSDEYTDQEKLHSIKDVLSLVTYNGITKNSIISAFRWLYDYCIEEANKPTTNGDKIRAMKDEELADVIAMKQCFALAINGTDGEDYTLDWLKEEVEE